MKSYMQKWKRLVVILLCSIMFGFGIMIAISGIHYAKAGNHKGKYAIKTSNVKMKSNAEGEKVIKTITIKITRSLRGYRRETHANAQAIKTPQP